MKLWKKMAAFRVKPDNEDLKSKGYELIGECDEKGILLNAKKAPKKTSTKKTTTKKSVETVEEDGLIDIDFPEK